MSAGTAGSVNSETKGFVVRGISINELARFEANGRVNWYGDAPSCFDTVRDALAAVYRAGQHYPSTSIGPMTIERKVETTVTETKTEYKPLVD